MKIAMIRAPEFCAPAAGSLVITVGGARQIDQIVKILEAEKVKPLILCAPKQTTISTAKIIAERMKVQFLPMRELEAGKYVNYFSTEIRYKIIYNEILKTDSALVVLIGSKELCHDLPVYAAHTLCGVESKCTKDIPALLEKGHMFILDTKKEKVSVYKTSKKILV